MLQVNALIKRASTRLTASIAWSPIFPRYFSAKRSGDVDEGELTAARQWLVNFDRDTIPREMCDVSFSRSSGPGGQNVNKVSSKATLRLPMSALLQRVPKVIHPSLMTSRYYAAKSNDIVIQADDSRKQNDNVNACFRKLHELIVQAARETVPGETTVEQNRRVEQLQKAEAAGRRKMKDFQSKKKGARRGGGKGDE